MNYTNLIPSHGFDPCPCVNIDQHAAHPTADRIVIDLEGDASDPLSAGAIYRGEQPAIDHAKEVFARFRAGAPKAKLGWYWFPPVARKEDVGPAVHFRELHALADFECPSLYSLHSRDLANLRRARWWYRAMSAHEFKSLPSVGFVCERCLDGTQCNTAQVRAQVNAAKAIWCDGIYVWSGVPYQVWLAKLPSASHSNEERSKAWARLVNDYGFRLGSSFDHADIDEEFAAYSERVLERFAREWGRA